MNPRPYAHNSTLRVGKPLKRSWIERKSPLAKQSKRKASQAGARRVCMAVVRKRSGGICEICRVCKARHGHEKLMRSHQGSDADPANVMHLCESCHRRVHENPSESYASGWLIRGNHR